MPELTPAEELRTAAATLRKSAERATDAPWYVVGPPWNDLTPFVVAGNPDPHVGMFVADPEHPTMSRRGTEGADAAWIALMHPGMADPLAAWLEQAADAFDDLIRTGCSDAAAMIYAPALAVARAIKGRGTEADAPPCTCFTTNPHAVNCRYRFWLATREDRP